MLANIVTAGFDNFIGIIIFLVVIGRIIGAVKKSASGAGSSAKTPGGERKVENDLEKFFASLANQNAGYAQEKQPPPPPIPAAVVKKAPRRAVAVPRKPLQPSPSTPPATMEWQPPEAAEIPWRGKPFGPSVPTGATCSEGASKARADIVRMLKDRNDIRTAIVLREILGPPVSLRM